MAIYKNAARMQEENMSLSADVSIQWFGHATFLLETSSGEKLMIDPWLNDNPSCPPELRNPVELDVILITHGHFDHISDAVRIAGQAKPAAVVGAFKACEWLKSKGVENTVGMNKGGTVEVPGAKVTMVHAVHSCGITDGDRIVYGGSAAGYVIDLDGGFSVYHAGDTDVFGDMQLIGELYRPDVALLPIGGHFTMGPRQAARACKLLGVARVVPMHYGTFPILTGTPDALRTALEAEEFDCEVVAVEPGERA